MAAAIVLVGVTTATACSTGPHGSRSGGSASRGPAMPPLSAYVSRPDLDAQLQTIDTETESLGLELAFEARGRLPSGRGPVVVRAYTGTDALGRRTHAVRVATSRGVVMAVGPLDAGAVRGEREEPTELLPALVPGPDGGAEGGAFKAAEDLNGDGFPDVVLRNEAGVLSVWRLAPMGASRYAMVMEALPMRALDVDGEGKIAFAGEVAVSPGDPLAPRLEDVAIFDGAGYSNRTAGARKWHARRAEALAALATAGAPLPAAAPPQAAGGQPTPGAPPPTVGAKSGPQREETSAKTESAPERPAVADDIRLRRALERAWHTLLAGESREEALKKLDRELVPEPLRASFNRFRRHVGSIRK